MAPSKKRDSGKQRDTAKHTSSSKREASSSNELFSYFSSVFGDRWPGLFQAVAASTSHVAFVNAFQAHLYTPDEGLKQFYSTKSCSFLRLSLPTGGGYPPPPPVGDMQLKAYYWMDFASALTPLLLDPQPGHRVLDMCAAPGGKSLILAALLFPPMQPLQQQQQQQQPESATPPTTGTSSRTDHVPQEQPQQQPAATDSEEAAAACAAQPLAAAAEDDPTARWRALTGQLTCNEADSVRRARLTRVLKEYLLPDELQRVRVTQNDGAGFWQRREAEEYDRVMLDAPCSSDRHAVQHNSSRSAVPKSQWSLATCRKLAAVQLKLLVGGLRALKVGGRLVYSTTSMADLQNGDVVRAALQRCGGAVRPCSDPELPIPPEQLQGWGWERAGEGWSCLPDRSPWGPAYVCVLVKGASIDCSTAGLLGLRQLAVGYGESSEEEEGDEDEEGEGTDL